MPERIDDMAPTRTSPDTPRQPRWRPARPTGEAASGTRAERAHRVARLAEAMSWPPSPERWRLDGEVRRRTAPLLAEMVSALGRLKAVLSGLTDDERPVVLDAPGDPGEIAASSEIAGFTPGRVVAIRWLEDEERRAATNPFAGLADRALKLLVPELEISLTELTVLLNEYLFHQEFELEELLDALPSDLLTALEETMPRWTDASPRQAAEVARLREHLADRDAAAEGADDD